MSNPDAVKAMARGAHAFDVAPDAAKALDEVFLQNLSESGGHLARLTVAHAMALFLCRTAKDGYLAAAGADGQPPINVSEVPFSSHLLGIAEALRAAADLFEAMDGCAPSAVLTPRLDG